MGKTTRRHFLKAAAAAGAVFGSPAYIRGALSGGRKPNILFIPVDDLRPQLGCYGRRQMISPNIDRLASEGTLFSRAYCNVPVCGASRASLLTGVRPTNMRFIDYQTWVRDEMPGALTLPQHFKLNGYHTLRNGKVFHHLHDAEYSWSEAPWYPELNGGTGGIISCRKIRRLPHRTEPAGPCI